MENHTATEQSYNQSKEQLSLLQTITIEVAAADHFSSALEVVLRRVCEKTGWVIGQAWVPNHDGTALDFGSVWFCGNGELRDFRAASEASHFRLGVGLPGRVWESKQPAWIEDVRDDPNFPRTATARNIGLKTAVGIPILSGDKVISVIEFFMRESRSKSEQLVKVIAAIAAQLNLVMERKRAEQELSRTNEILQSILSNMGDAVIVADKDGKLLVFNPVAERFFGPRATQTTPSEWSRQYGLYLPDQVTLFPPDQLPLTRSIRGEEVNNVEIFVRREKAARGLWVRVNGRPLRGPKGERLGGVVVCLDITQFKEEEFFRAGQSRVLEMIGADAPLADVLTSLVLLMEGQAEGLRCSILLLNRDGKHVRHGAAPNLPEAYVKAVDGAPIGPRNGSCGTAMYTRRPVVVTDVMTDPLWADYRELAQIYGFDSNLPLTCELILSRVHPDERAAVKAEYDRACSLHGAFESEHRLLLPYGKTRWVIMRGRCLQDEHGNLLETIGVTLDVSPQKQAALQLQVQREEMAHRNRVALMGEMTASFAHELNQPLTAIANNASAARRFLEHGNIDPALLQQLLQDMVADSQRAGEVIRGIRSLVRKETSVHALLDLNAVITETVRLVSTDVLNRESVVTTELDPHLPEVQAALVQIQQVLLNLIINALDSVEGLPPPERRIIINTR